MVDIIFTLWSDRSMRPNYNQVLKVARQAGGNAVARSLPVKAELLALGSLLALLIIGRGAGTG
jgi:hypothetical protein